MCLKSHTASDRQATWLQCPQRWACALNSIGHWLTCGTGYLAVYILTFPLLHKQSHPLLALLCQHHLLIYHGGLIEKRPP